jgi:hypothetical protein
MSGGGGGGGGGYLNIYVMTSVFGKNVYGREN